MDNQNQTTLFLVRHGQTDLPYSSIESIDNQRKLSGEGIKQAKLAGRYFRSIRPLIIFSSPAHRCRQTAEIISTTAGYDQPIKIEPRINEGYDQIDWSGISSRCRDFVDMVLINYAGISVIAVTHHMIISCLINEIYGGSIREIPTASVWRLLFAGSSLVHVDALNPAGTFSRQLTDNIVLR